MSIQPESIARLKEFEGCVPWMYLDTRGNVTVWVGFELPSAERACALPFREAGGSTIAGEAAIATEWRRVKSMPAGKLPHFYRGAPSLELHEPDGDALLLLRWKQDEIALRALYPGYDVLPDAAKIALHDMIFNLGGAALRHEYPHLRAAIESGDFVRAAAECVRHGIAEKRNVWTAQQFQLALKSSG